MEWDLKWQWQFSQASRRMNLSKCINQQNALALTKLPGIGKKTAERLLIEMKDSIQQLWSNDCRISYF